ncbi:hypothetical protein G9444_0475 [Rhodococcus erythropolis]|uniref:Uncharacterized protein n=1 Tax=Rhodococcus erythropolis TaxID=1833 RepID=A0A6G9CLM7_RHOER|nr:hypothetical protein G9444_0475 [Rhodococcus erythropolis]
MVRIQPGNVAIVAGATNRLNAANFVFPCALGVLNK